VAHHAQQDGGSVGIPPGGEPSNISRFAVLALLHVVTPNVDTLPRPNRMRRLFVGLVMHF
jgi:hypothetical protein